MSQGLRDRLTRLLAPRKTAPAAGVDNVWKAFQQEQMRDIVNAIQSYSGNVMLMWVALLVGSILKYDLSILADEKDNKMSSIAFFSAGACSLGLIGMWWSGRGGWNLLNFLQHYYQGSDVEWYYSIAHIGLFINLLMVVAIWQILFMPVEVDRQKAFISSYFVFGWFATNNCYLPLGWTLALAIFPMMCFWFFWHWATGFLDPQAYIWGIAWPAVGVVGFRVFEKREFARCQARHQADEARVLSECLRNALQSMLGSVFDASCECDSTGQIMTASPQWEQLFGQQLPNLNLTALAANTEEARRIAALLEQSLQQCGARASPCAKIETSLYCRTERPRNITNELRVILCCVAFPCDSDSASKSRILIGFQRAQLTEELAKLMDASYLSESMPSASNADSTEQVPSVPQEVLLQRWPKLQAEAVDMETRSESIFTLTETLASSLQQASVSSVSVATQTETLTPVIQVRTWSIGTQTLYRSPLPPVPLRDKGVRWNPFEVHHSPGRAPVILKTRRVVKPEFTETPRDTIQQIIWESLHRFNPRGKGCCFKHITLQALLKHACDMMAFPCSSSVGNNFWQCKGCFALQTTEEEDNDDLDFVCSLCSYDNFEPNVTRQDEEDASSSAADDEACLCASESSAPSC